MCAVLSNLRGLSPDRILEICNMKNMIPVDLEKICDDLDIQCYPVDFVERSKDKTCDIYGAIICKGQDMGIFYSDRDSLSEQRFTIAHEIAHCCLDTDSVIEHHYEFRSESTKKNEKEKRMNQFAAELLMPEEHIRRICSQLTDIPDTYSLAKLFQVPERSMEKRLVSLGFMA